MRQNATFADKGKTWSRLQVNNVGYLSNDPTRWNTVGLTDDGKAVYTDRGEYIGNGRRNNMGRVTYSPEGYPYWDELGGRYRQTSGRSYEDSLGERRETLQTGDIFDWLLGPMPERDAKYAGAVSMPLTAEIVNKVLDQKRRIDDINTKIATLPDPWRTQAVRQWKDVMYTESLFEGPWYFAVTKKEWNDWADARVPRVESRITNMYSYLASMQGAIQASIGMSPQQVQVMAQKFAAVVDEKAPIKVIKEDTAQTKEGGGRTPEAPWIEKNWPYLALGGLGLVTIAAIAA